MKEQIKKRIEDYKVELDKIDDRIFIINMIDHWTEEDKKILDRLQLKYDALDKEIKVLEEELKNGKTN